MRSPGWLEQPKIPLWGHGVLQGTRRTPLGERWDPLQGGVTRCGFGLAPSPPWWEGLGVLGAPGMPVGEQPGWQHPRATAQGEQPGEGWGCGAGGFGVRAGLMGGWGALGMRVHMCACVSVSMCVHLCAYMELPFPQSLLWGREGMPAGKDLGC